MTPEQVLALAQAAMRTQGAYSYTNHFWDRMQDRNATVGDVKRSIRTATGAELRENGTWRLKGGKDADEIALEPVIEILGDQKIRLITILD